MSSFKNTNTYRLRENYLINYLYTDTQTLHWSRICHQSDHPFPTLPQPIPHRLLEPQFATALQRTKPSPGL